MNVDTKILTKMLKFVLFFFTNFTSWKLCLFLFNLSCFPISVVRGKCVLSCYSCVWLFATPWTVARQAPLSMGFFRQEYWSGLPPPGDLPHPEIELESLAAPALQADSLPLSHQGSPVLRGIHFQFSLWDISHVFQIQCSHFFYFPSTISVLIFFYSQELPRRVSLNVCIFLYYLLPLNF